VQPAWMMMMMMMMMVKFWLLHVARYGYGSSTIRVFVAYSRLGLVCSMVADGKYNSILKYWDTDDNIARSRVCSQKTV
jgi:hypothetical protein